MRKFLFVGDHADTLASGRPLAPGDEPIDATHITPDRQPDQDMLAQGVLIALPDDSLGDIAGMSIDAVLKYVGGNAERRNAALAAEHARGDQARSSLIEKLTKETG